MYATIRRDLRVDGSIDSLIAQGRRLTAAMSSMPGFVAYALIDAGAGELVSVSIFDDEAGLAAADRLVQEWLPRADTTTAPATGATGGEVIIQKGL